jgi:four helix bundle protein
MAIRDVEDLHVYNNSMNLLKPIYRLASLLPKYEEQKFRAQLTSAAKSIPALIAEGFAKQQYPKEYCRFLLMALGSSDEVITHLRQIQIIEFPGIKKETCISMIKKYKIISKQINSLIQIWRKY